jgi:hypothetical protein
MLTTLRCAIYFTFGGLLSCSAKLVESRTNRSYLTAAVRKAVAWRGPFDLSEQRGPIHSLPSWNNDYGYQSFSNLFTITAAPISYLLEDLLL